LWNETLKQEFITTIGSRFKYTSRFERIVQNSLGNVKDIIDMSRQRGILQISHNH
jgi:hypothetical protein